MKGPGIKRTGGEIRGSAGTKY